MEVARMFWVVKQCLWVVVKASITSCYEVKSGCHVF